MEKLKIMKDIDKYCPECAGIMGYESKSRCLVCFSCGLSLKHNEYYTYWRKIKNQERDNIDEYQQKKKRRKEWLRWYGTSKDEK